MFAYRRRVGVGSSTAILCIDITQAGDRWLALLTYLIPLLAILVAAILFIDTPRGVAGASSADRHHQSLVDLLHVPAAFNFSAPRLQPTSPPAEPPRNVGENALPLFHWAIVQSDLFPALVVKHQYETNMLVEVNAKSSIPV